MADESKQKPKVLIVDDDKFLLDMYAVKFGQNDFEVVTSLGSVDAISKLKDGFTPDVILTDILMPVMDGFEFIEQIKKDNIAPNAKIIILSNKGERSDIDRGMSLGADGYIVKANIIPSEVVQKINEVLK